MKIKLIHISWALGIIFGILNLVGVATLISMIADPTASYSSSPSSEREERRERRKRNRVGAVTRAKIQFLGEAIERYRAVFGHAPKAKTSVHLCRYFIDIGYFENTHEMRNFPMDEWGGLLMYNHGNKFTNGYNLFSLGPNKMFDKKSGDDIVWENGRFTN